MEWGPRALGNRSILCDPRRGDIKATPERQDQAARKLPAVCPFGPRRRGRRMVRGGRRRSFHGAGVPGPRRKTIANPGGHSYRRVRPFADRLSSHEPALLSTDRVVPRSDRNTAGAQHLVQRERADRLPTGGGARLLSAHQDGHARDRRHDHFTRRHKHRRGAATHAIRRGHFSWSANTPSQFAGGGSIWNCAIRRL